jgi:hypothetical protein
MECPILPKKEGDTAAQQFHCQGVDILTLQKLVERDYSIPEPQTAEKGHGSPFGAADSLVLSPAVAQLRPGGDPLGHDEEVGVYLTLEVDPLHRSAEFVPVHALSRLAFKASPCEDSDAVVL